MTKSSTLRALAAAGSFTLFGVAIGRAQMGCSSPSTPLAAESAVVAAAPSASPPPTVETVEIPAATAKPLAEDDPRWFSASKAGPFLPPQGSAGVQP